MKVSVFDPPMCCSTGICGVSVDPAIIRFAADLEWLEDHGVEVQRFNLAQEPGAFANTAQVKQALASEGNACLPMILVDGEVMCKGRYPNREMLAAFARVDAQPVAGRSSARASCCGPDRRGRSTGGSGCC